MFKNGLLLSTAIAFFIVYAFTWNDVLRFNDLYNTMCSISHIDFENHLVFYIFKNQDDMTKTQVIHKSNYDSYDIIGNNFPCWLENATTIDKFNENYNGGIWATFAIVFAVFTVISTVRLSDELQERTHLPFMTAVTGSMYFSIGWFFMMIIIFPIVSNLSISLNLKLTVLFICSLTSAGLASAFQRTFFISVFVEIICNACNITNMILLPLIVVKYIDEYYASIVGVLFGIATGCFIFEIYTFNGRLAETASQEEVTSTYPPLPPSQFYFGVDIPPPSYTSEPDLQNMSTISLPPPYSAVNTEN